MLTHTVRFSTNRDTLQQNSSEGLDAFRFFFEEQPTQLHQAVDSALSPPSYVVRTVPVWFHLMVDC